MTTPNPAQLYRLLAEMRQAGAECAVMEVTSHALTFSKVSPLRFHRAVFTNLTPDHLDLHGDMESYFLEKRKLFSLCEGAVISERTPYGGRLADSLEVPLWLVGENTVTEVKYYGAEGVSFSLRLPDGAALTVEMGVPGEFSVENGALAALTAVSMGVPACVVKGALSRFAGVRGRMERIGPPDFCAAVFADYAHTPDALERLLRTARGFCGVSHRVTVLFGCGGDRDRSKRAPMGRIASALADLVILTSDNCRTEHPEDILRDVLKGVDKEKPYKVIADRREAIRYAIDTAREGDVILLAGKGHEEYEIKGSERLRFSERDIVAAAIAARREREADAH
jgi:UDP-N-acetylmuramoyl-L-alanyl-D-glutamate--2,6-diaminopimelate ligase